MSFFEIITPADTAILDFIQNTIKCEILDVVMAFLSYIGNGGMLWIAAAIVMIFFRSTRKTGIMILCALIIGFLIGEVGLKNLLCRPRPFAANPNIEPNIVFHAKPPQSYSCPSGHSCSSFAAATAIFANNKRIGIPAFCAAFLIAFSRIYNYVHYPSDVLFGIMLGIICYFIVFIIFRKTGLDSRLSENHREKRI